jgi:cbb3-type cytochrome oxidase subunit 3
MTIAREILKSSWLLLFVVVIVLVLISLYGRKRR